jgi:hypothetical protein
MNLEETGRASGEAEVEEQEAVHSAQSTECMSCDLQWNICHTCNPAQTQIHSIYCLTGITFRNQHKNHNTTESVTEMILNERFILKSPWDPEYFLIILLLITITGGVLFL